jgi:Pyrimidine dimer DNA glycosylase
MQTFLADPSFDGCAVVLDNKRLNKQLLEGRQILSALATGKGWIHHPATKMWAGYEVTLLDYLDEIRYEAHDRGIKTDTNWNAILDIFANHTDLYKNTKLPWWWNNPFIQDNIIVTHRGRLYIKDPEHYHQYEWEGEIYRNYVCCTRCNYYWPTHS